MNTTTEYTAETFKRMIASEYDQLPRNQKSVADFLIKNLNQAAFLSVVEIGSECGVSKATVVRFAQSLGFDGFISFRNSLQKAVQKKYDESETGRFRLIKESGGKSVYKVASQDVSNINKTIDRLNLDEFNAVVDLMSASENIFTFGLGISALVSQIMSYSLNQVAMKSQSVLYGQLSFEEQLMFMGDKDAIVCFSFPPYSKRTIEVACMAREKGVKVIGITDRETAPIVEHCTRYLCVESENLLFTNSVAALSVVVNAIVTELAVRNKDEALAYIDEVNSLMKKSGHFH